MKPITVVVVRGDETVRRSVKQAARMIESLTGALASDIEQDLRAGNTFEVGAIVFRPNTEG